MVFPDPFSLVIYSVGDGVTLRLQVACLDEFRSIRQCFDGGEAKAERAA